MPVSSSRWSRLLAAACLIVLFGVQHAHALHLSRVAVEPSLVFVSAAGPIVPGDGERLRAFLAALPKNDRLYGFAVDSPGGNIFEAKQIAALMRGHTILVPRGGQCASACFLLFAAAAHRIVAEDARIGVHSASEAGSLTRNSLVFTDAVARDLREDDVPPAIIAKMAATAPDRMVWLTRAELQSMGVSICLRPIARWAGARDARRCAVAPTSQLVIPSEPAPRSGDAHVAPRRRPRPDAADAASAN